MLKLRIHENAQTSFEMEFPAEKEIKVGRNENSDLVLRSRRVSREHCRIFCQDGQWHVEDLNSQNGIRVNGSIVKSELIKDNDNIQIGDYRIEVMIQPEWSEDQTVVKEDDRTVIFEDQDEPDRTVVSQPPGASESPEGPLQNILTRVLKNRILAGSVAGVLILFLLILIFAPSKKEVPDTGETIVTVEQEKAKVINDLQTLHRIDVYLQSGKDQLEAGNFSEALVRFQAVLEIDPGNQPALEFLGMTRQKMAEAEEMRRIALEEEQKRMERVRAISSQARQAIAREDLVSAREIIAEAVFLEPGNPDVLKLQADIENAIKAQNLSVKKGEQQRLERIAQVKQHFDQGQRYYDQGNYLSALAEWEKVLAIDIESPETAHTRHAIPQLRKLLEQDIQKEYEKAMNAYKDNDLTKAMGHLQKVSLVSPDYRETRKYLSEVFLKVESKARRLYQEGLVYEGLGQRARAVDKWREVIKVMPLEDNEYYKKAMERLR
ncbi:MAG: FHA domain-containing protein [Deltaproteobacteria bacterium]|nr:FHA domain-containing protein [Deltaproteobacteria bacterium]